MSETDWIYLLFCMIVSFCFIFNEFASAGISVTSLCGNYLGDEYSQFIQYHIKRTCASLVIHSLLPICFIFLRYLNIGGEIGDSIVFQITIALGLILPASVFSLVYFWRMNDWECHPIVKAINVYAYNNSNWQAVAVDINREYRNQNRMEIKMSSVSSLIITENWIIKTLPYKLYITHQSDTELVADKTDSHEITEQGIDIIQFVTIQIKPNRPNSENFQIRIKATQFKDIQDRLNRRVHLLPNVKLQPSLMERWLVAFEEQVKANPKYVYNDGGDLDACFACFAMEPNIKIWKTCWDIDVNGEELPEEDRCKNCYCRPMWCIGCMARWFSARQEEGPETWLEKKTPCPMCRSKFCILDVCFIEKERRQADLQ